MHRPSPATGSRGSDSVQRGEAVVPRTRARTESRAGSIYRGRASSGTTDLDRTTRVRPGTRLDARDRSGSLLDRTDRGASAIRGENLRRDTDRRDATARDSARRSADRRGSIVPRSSTQPTRATRSERLSRGATSRERSIDIYRGARAPERASRSRIRSGEALSGRDANGFDRRGSASRITRGSTARTARTDRTRRVEDIVRKNPRSARQLHYAGQNLLRVQDTMVRVGFGLATGSNIRRGVYGGNRARDFGRPSRSHFGFGFGFGYGHHFGRYDPWCYNWFWGSNSRFYNYCGWYGGSSWWAAPSYLSCWYPWWRNYWVPTYYVPYTATQVIYQTAYEPVYVDSQPAAAAPVGEAWVPNAAAGRPAAPSSLSLAAERYLSLGDTAFREGRFTDAVQFYSKAIEYAPGQGALYLLLADALFAAGDYHYAAYAIRRAYELEPELLTNPVDKHAFYDDPAVYDRQIAVLEQYVADRSGDRDARLVLALNYLFAGRPAAAVDLLRDLDSQTLVGEDVAQALLETGMRLEYGGR
ncbi:MAG: tetratricopeptide repeat protein [Planctomycetota bacterium]